MTDNAAEGDESADVPEWLTEAVDRLARGTPSSLDGLLESVGDAITIDGTKATCRCHFIRRNANGQPRLRDLARRLAEGVLDYCIPRSRIEEADKHRQKTGSSHLLVRLAVEATALFTAQKKSGEGGELLLYTLLETVLGIPQILCKMSLKTNSNMHIHGTDGVHAKALPNGNLALYWGESKLHSTVESAVDDCFDSIAPFLLEDATKAADRDLLLVRDHLDAGSEEITAALIKYFSQDEPESAKLELRAACLVGFSYEDYPDPHAGEGQEVVAEVADAIEKWQSRVGARVNKHLLQSFELEVFFVPVPSVDDFRDAMHNELGLK